MKKKSLNLSKFFALLLSCLILLSAGNAVSVSAADQTDKAAALTKQLKMPTGVATPKADLTFKFTKVSADPTPDLDPVTLNIEANAAGTDDAGVKTVSVRKVIDQISTAAGKKFENIPAGVYTYTVKEDASGIDTTAVGKITKQAEYSKAEYTLKVVVSNKTDASGTPIGTYISQVNVIPVKDDDGNTPADTTSKLSTEDGDGNKFIFTNKYSTTVEEDTPNDPDHAPFSVEKKVTGDGDIYQAFDFSITVDKPALLAVATPETTYTYSIVKADGNVDPDHKAVTGTYGTPLTFNLKHGEKLVINKMYGGSTIKTVDETNAYGHDKTLTYTPAGGQAEESQTAVTDKLITGQGNKLLVKNDKKPSTEVGLFLDNAPIILVITLSVVAILAFAVVNKKRKASR